MTIKKIIKKSKNLGFTLIELMLVLSISILVGLAAIEVAKREAEITKANNVADQFKEIGAALSTYILRNYGAMTGAPSTVVTLNNLIADNLLPATFKNTNLFGSNYNLLVVRSTNGTGQTVLNGMIGSSGAWTDDGGRIRYDLLGASVKKLGAQGGMSFFSANTATGLDGSWTLGSASYPIISTAGQLFYRTFYGFGSNYDDIYLRRDGSLAMLGALNMGTHDVNAVVNLTASGLITADSLLAVNGNITNIFSNKINGTGVAAEIKAFDLLQTTATGRLSTANINTNPADSTNLFVGSTSTASGPTGRGYVYADDMYVRDIRGNGSWLSQRLPTYSSRGIYAVSDGSILSPKPNCGAGGNPRIEVIAQSQFIQGRVLGSVVIDDNPVSPNYGKISHDLYSVGGIATSATDNGASWTVNLKTPTYDGTYVGTTGLAHVYCNYGS